MVFRTITDPLLTTETAESKNDQKTPRITSQISVRIYGVRVMVHLEIQETQPGKTFRENHPNGTGHHTNTYLHLGAFFFNWF